ncbi:hypothetical protein [Altererythrobacter sp.]|uniref:hypothetical protein n=1 Tax=Altererythrobacter sp. TaxID=1872480 RepID=UPI001B2670F7|nr:hypothetical protein [Altererythrobacter sp.]MBO6610376.1 hypothetical protein [Altererythrobacter sp.]MBO6642646.1 hypothetical protein [Altererythrobacter sp.]MBO6708846.1 hypothetical protein [Altererythrobacter sp.]
MDWDLITIFGFVLLVCMIVFPFAARTHRRSVEHEERKLELLARAEEAKAGNAGVDQSAYRKLEERVRVLERIATDGKQDLALQIEQLRDLQEIDDLATARANQQEAAR